MQKASGGTQLRQATGSPQCVGIQFLLWSWNRGCLVPRGPARLAEWSQHAGWFLPWQWLPSCHCQVEGGMSFSARLTDNSRWGIGGCCWSNFLQRTPGRCWPVWYCLVLALQRALEFESPVKWCYKGCHVIAFHMKTCPFGINRRYQLLSLICSLQRLHFLSCWRQVFYSSSLQVFGKRTRRRQRPGGTRCEQG